MNCQSPSAHIQAADKVCLHCIWEKLLEINESIKTLKKQMNNVEEQLIPKIEE